MKSVHAARLILIIFSCMASASCVFPRIGAQQQGQPQSIKPGQQLKPGQQVPPQLVKPQPGYGAAFDQYAAEVRNHLNGGEFALLESMASKARKGKERFPGGMWKLNAFYNGLGAPAAGDGASEEEWQEHLGLLRKWVGQDPGSVTARVGLGSALVSYAWKARGQGYAASVSGSGWQLFRQRLEQAAEALGEEAGLREKCPHWYVAMLQVGLGQDWEPSRFERLYEKGVALEPTYYYLYRIRAMYLMPRWKGEPGEWEKFADEVSGKLGGKEGAAVYFLIVSHIRGYYGMRFFEENKAPWPKILEGYRSLEGLYGTNTRTLNDACMLASLAKDRPVAEELFNRIGEDWDAEVWGNRAYFEALKAWSRPPAKS